jgi:hypothetical protein
MDPLTGGGLAGGLVAFSDTSGFAGAIYASGKEVAGYTQYTNGTAASTSTVNSSATPATNVLRYALGLGTGAWMNRLSCCCHHRVRDRCGCCSP